MRVSLGAALNTGIINVELEYRLFFVFFKGPPVGVGEGEILARERETQDGMNEKFSGNKSGNTGGVGWGRLLQPAGQMDEMKGEKEDWYLPRTDGKPSPFPRSTPG